MPDLITLLIADPPELWASLGFETHAGSSFIGGVEHRLGAAGHGVVAWALRGADGLSELPRADADPPEQSPGRPHPNGVTELDHVVVFTPDLGRTIGAFESAQLPLRRTREAGTADRPMTQAFFKLGPVIVEVVGVPEATGPGPARFYGLAFTVADLEATIAFLGGRLRPAKDAVQSGRRIATLDRSVGSSIPLAFMSGAPPRDDPDTGLNRA
jgi:hypothetical protein